MESILTDSKMYTKPTDKISTYKEFTVIESFSGDISGEDFLKQLIAHHISKQE